MRNTRDEKYDDQEEGEYHFSDEDANYQVESDAPKSASISPPSGNMMARLTQSKRMLISAGVFLVLVFVVFKMVSPSTQSIPTEIVPAPVARNKAPVVEPTTMPSQPAPAPSVVAAVPAPSAPIVSQPAPATPAPMIAPATPVAQTAPASAAPAPSAPSPSAVALQKAAVPSFNEATAQFQAMQQQMLQAPPAQAPAPSQATPAVVLPSAQTIDAQVATVSAKNDKLTADMQADYTQKLTSFENQNKALQDQVQILNSRVALMESQINQLVQTLTRQSQGGTNTGAVSSVLPGMTGAPVAATPQEANPAPLKTSYNVQAIIPGRAWLRSDAGEAVTVAEGDVIKDLGRVTKIDPYDGVVEINTGSKVVSLSYGNTG